MPEQKKSDEFLKLGNFVWYYCQSELIFKEQRAGTLDKAAT